MVSARIYEEILSASWSLPELNSSHETWSYSMEHRTWSYERMIRPRLKNLEWNTNDIAWAKISGWIIRPLNAIVAYQLQRALFDLYRTLFPCCPKIVPAGIFPDQATGLDHCGRYANWERPVHKNMQYKTWVCHWRKFQINQIPNEITHYRHHLVLNFHFLPMLIKDMDDCFSAA